MVLPPLFQFIRGDKMSRTFCPWPFYQRETGLREKVAVWPLYVLAFVVLQLVVLAQPMEMRGTMLMGSP